MKLKTGLKSLMGISIIAIAAAIYDIVTCPLSALLSFMTAQRLSSSEYETLRQQGAAVSTLRGFPVSKSEIFAVEASFLAVAVFLAVIVLSYLILRQRGFQLLGVPITPQFMGLAVFLIGVWNLFFSGFLAVERTYVGMAFWPSWMFFDATVVAFFVVSIVSYRRSTRPLRLKSFDNLDEWQKHKGTHIGK